MNPWAMCGSSPNEVGAAIQPLLPAKQPHPREDRTVLSGIIDVLRPDHP
jgi:transposase